MDLQAFFVSERGTGLAMSLSRAMPPRVGLAFVDLVVRIVARRKEAQPARGIRLNQGVARGLPFDAPELDDAVLQVLRNAGRGYYYLYHLVSKGIDAVSAAVTFDPAIDRLVQEHHGSDRGVVIVGPHLGNFDLALVAFGARGYDIQAITYSVPPGGYQLQNQLRADAGFVITPADGAAVKQALQRLKAGGVVLTGIDRPLPDPDPSDRVEFFGHPAPLPTGYARLALSTGALVAVIRIEAVGESRWHVEMGTTLEMERTGNRKEDARHNTERVLATAAEWISRSPAEWMLFVPIWPDLLPG